MAACDTVVRSEPRNALSNLLFPVECPYARELSAKVDVGSSCTALTDLNFLLRLRKRFNWFFLRKLPDDFDVDPNYTVVFVVRNPHKRLFGQIDFAAADVRPAIIDLHYDRFPVYRVGHFDFCPERKFPMCRGQIAVGEAFTAGRLAPVEFIVIVRGIYVFLVGFPRSAFGRRAGNYG